MAGPGAPDWVHIIQIRGLDEAGDLHDVRVDDAGRIIMLSYGYTGTLYVPIKTDEFGNLIARMTGIHASGLTTIATDDVGRMLALIYDPDTSEHLAIDAEGYGTVVIKGTDGTDLLTLRTDDLGRLLALIYDPDTDEHLAIDSDGYGTMVVKGTDGTDLLTLRTDALGRLIALFRDPVSDNYAAISDEGYLSALIRGAADVRLDCETWYRFRNQEGTTIKDSSGNGRDGLGYSGVGLAAAYADGIVGDSISFDGADDYVDMPADAALDNMAAVSYELWYNCTDITDALPRIFDKDAERYLVFGPLRRLDFYIEAATTNARSYADDVFEFGTWYHIVITYDDNGDRKSTIYINGLRATQAQTAAVGALDDDSGNALTIGGVGTSNSFHGFVDEFRIYSRVLSPEEILWRYKRTHVSLEERYRPLSVDPEGRLEVAIGDFAYKDQVLERGSTVYAGGGNQNEQSAVCPAGKMWVITAAGAHSNGSACASIDIGIYDGVDNFIFASDLSGANVFQVNYQGQLILKPGDRLNFAWGHGAGAYTSDWTLCGFELDYPY